MAPATTYLHEWKQRVYRSRLRWKRRRAWDTQKQTQATMWTVLTPDPSLRFWPASACDVTSAHPIFHASRLRSSRQSILFTHGNLAAPFDRYHALKKNCRRGEYSLPRFSLPWSRSP